ncbi:alpha/beta hydrolase [Pseudofulvibacter geojedonensis]|uniref:Alpha/beta hydrolase n=1 Tax=Pseudofulvibacter geojedonensis TaxID=1123758 RepID=A0ABW3I2K2_9FLAO
MTEEKTISYTINNTYSTLNKLTNATKNNWFVIHGLGFLSKYFIKYFDELNKEENYIVAPQAQNKHYLKNQYKHVGTTWLTKNNTQFDIVNVLAHLDAVYSAEGLPESTNNILLGFSQGVSIVTRWVASRQIPCNTLVLYAGKIPREFKPNHFKHISRVLLIVGDKDEYVTTEVLLAETKYAQELFGNKLEIKVFDGTHEMKKNIINSILS